MSHTWTFHFARPTWACLVTLITLVSMALPAQAQQAAGNVNLAAALDDAALIGILSPQRLLADKSMKLLPTELITTAGVEEFGLDLLTIGRVFVFMKTPESLEQPPQAGFIMYLTEPADEAAIVQATGAQQLPGQETKAYMSPKLPLAFTFANPSTIVAVSDPALFEPILTQPTGRPSGVLVDLITTKGAGNDIAFAVWIDKLRPLLKPAFAEDPALAPPFESVKTLPDHISTLEVHAKLTEGGTIGMTVNAVDEAAAAEVEKMANNYLQLAKQMIMQEIEGELPEYDPEDPYAVATQQYLKRVSGKVTQILSPHREGSELVFFDHPDGPQLNGTVLNGLMFGGIVPAVMAGRESVQRLTSQNKMKQIGIALHNYHDTYRKFPAQASYDENGKPLLSWRVHILPFIEQRALYEQFHLDEPWDSPHNIELSKVVVEVYSSPELPKSNKTVYLAPVGQGLFMNGDQQTSIASIRDGTSNTIMLVEADADQAIIWTKPDDLEVDLDDPWNGLGTLREGMFNAGFADGSVHSITREVTAEMLKGLFTIAGSEVIQLP